MISGLRGRLLLMVVLAVAVALAVAMAAFNVVLARTLRHDANDVLRARAAAELAALDVVGGRLELGEAPDTAAAESEVWVFAGSRVLEEPKASTALRRAALSLAGGPRRYLDVPALETRLYATPVVSAGRRVGTVVTGLSLDPYEQTQHTALIGSLVLGGLLLTAAALIARWLLTSALRPVARMTEQASDWSERDLDRRFALGVPHDELTRLAHTLDGLLDRIAASLRREQRFSAELSHELRTPLAAITAEAELALRRDRPASEYRRALQHVLEGAERATRAVDALVAAAHQAASGRRGTSDARAAAASVAEACAHLGAERGIEIAVDGSDGSVRVGADADVVERILQPIIENACRYGRHRVGVSFAKTDGMVTFAVEDDGPGVADADRARIFDPGERGSAGEAGAPGAGLGLALARRLARSVGGDVGLDRKADGARFVVRLPAS